MMIAIAINAYMIENVLARLPFEVAWISGLFVVVRCVDHCVVLCAGGVGLPEVDVGAAVADVWDVMPCVAVLGTLPVLVAGRMITPLLL
jgi:hypothetical protein